MLIIPKIRCSAWVINAEDNFIILPSQKHQSGPKWSSGHPKTNNSEGRKHRFQTWQNGGIVSMTLHSMPSSNRSEPHATAQNDYTYWRPITKCFHWFNWFSHQATLCSLLLMATQDKIVKSTAPSTVIPKLQSSHLLTYHILQIKMWCSQTKCFVQGLTLVPLIRSSVPLVPFWFVVMVLWCLILFRLWWGTAEMYMLMS